MNIFCSPSWPVLTNSSSNVEHFIQSFLDFFLQDQILLPRMKSSNSLFFRTPHSKMFDNSIKYNQIFIISLLKIIFDLIRIVAFPHKTVGNLINLIISILSDQFSNIFYIDLIPIFFLIDMSKCCFEDIQLHSLDERR